jgi:hypothetical protein
VFDDKDGDGERDAGEKGVAGVPIVLDGQVVGTTDAEGYFSVPLPGSGKALLTIVPPEGWQWAGEPLDIEGMDKVAIPLRQQKEQGNQAPAPITTAATVTGGVAIAALLVGLAFNGFASLSQAASMRSLERTYRRQKAQEMEYHQYNVVVQRQEELTEILAQTGGWQEVLRQVITDASPDVSTGWLTLVSIAVSPVPHFVVFGDEREYVFTVSPNAMRSRAQRLFQRDQVVPLDASLSPAVRVEVQAVWRCLAEQQSLDAGGLPRQAEWFLIARRKREAKRG